MYQKELLNVNVSISSGKPAWGQGLTDADSEQNKSDARGRIDRTLEPERKVRRVIAAPIGSETFQFAYGTTVL